MNFWRRDASGKQARRALIMRAIDTLRINGLPSAPSARSALKGLLASFPDLKINMLAATIGGGVTTRQMSAWLYTCWECDSRPRSVIHPCGCKLYCSPCSTRLGAAICAKCGLAISSISMQSAPSISPATMHRLNTYITAKLYHLVTSSSHPVEMPELIEPDDPADSDMDISASEM